ncbi:70 kDa peptidyl-prolyl isomerase, partial [Trifolium medium]|nr:70 kDa peptidyl-prolyl isomerase [Trifolium medium]
IVNIRDGRGDLGGGWFGECVSKKVGDGVDTFFLTDPWLSGIPLRARRGGVGVTETVVGVGGGDVGGVSGITSQFLFADSVFRYMVPLKVSIFAWRLLRDRLPTKANLAARCIITPAAHLCVSGCSGVESAQHLFLSCSTFGSLWSSVASERGGPFCSSFG